MSESNKDKTKSTSRESKRETAKSDKNPKVDKVLLQINHVDPMSQPLKYANHLLVQHSPDGEFFLLFFEVQPPIVLVPDEVEGKKKLQEIGQIDARCIARIVLRKDKMRSMIAALAKNYEDYEKHVQSQRTEEDQSDAVEE